MPQLTAAAKAGRLSRQVSMLAAGREENVNLDDLALKKSFSLRNCAAHATTMNSLIAIHLAGKYPGTTFIHMSPGVVKTNIMRGFGMPKILNDAISFAVTPFALPLTESGERNCFAGTATRFGPQSAGSEGMATGSDGKTGGGAYLLNWRDEAVGNHKVLKPYKEQGVEELVYRHTMDVFDKVCTQGERW
jgi:hypothetical protein